MGLADLKTLLSVNRISNPEQSFSYIFLLIQPYSKKKALNISAFR